MPVELTIDLLQYQEALTIQRRADKTYIFDPIRKKYLVLTPEEVVRQLLLIHLTQTVGISSAKIAVEKAIQVGQQIKRFDALIYDQAFTPFLIIECKATTVNITDQTFEQVAWYNFELQADYLFVTNGLKSYCCRVDHQEKDYEFIDYLPLPNVNG